LSEGQSAVVFFAQKIPLTGVSFFIKNQRNFAKKGVFGGWGVKFSLDKKVK
jgi:hypothetical protein